MKYHRLRLELILVLTLAACPVLASPPRRSDFTNRILLGGDEGTLWAPLTTFNIEIKKIEPTAPPRHTALPSPTRNHYLQTADVGVSDLVVALEKSGMPAQKREELRRRYREFRREMQYYGSNEYYTRNTWRLGTKGLYQYDETNWRGWEDRKAGYPALERLRIPEDVPLEFRLYLRGALLYYQNDWPRAREYWQALLRLPSNQRRYRSTWSAFMIGKTTFDDDPDEAEQWFDLVGTLAADGFEDNLGLAAESYVWRAKVKLHQDANVRAIELFVDALVAGYKGKGVDFGRALHGIFKSPEAMEEAARNTVARDVINAYFASYSNNVLAPPPHKELDVWLEVLEKERVRNLRSADVIAWAAYNNGRMDLAQRWLNRARKTSGLSLWLQAKLHLRGGRTREAAKLLERAVKKFPPEESWRGTSRSFVSKYNIDGLRHTGVSPRKRILAELGAVQLSIEQFEKSLHSFMLSLNLKRRHYWYDVLYLAERVLGPDELKDYVDRKWPDPVQPSGQYQGAGPDTKEVFENKTKAARIRYVLARRLARLGRWEEARQYYPENLLPVLDSYLKAIHRGQNLRLSESLRADAFWEAGEIARRSGMDLLEIEIEPPWTRDGRGYKLDRVSTRRLQGEAKTLLGGGDLEQARVRTSITEAGEKYHFHYVARDHYWSAIELMPDDTDETARRACIAGSHIKYVDPDAAFPFYHTLVHRCRHTELGRATEAKKWFPVCEPEKREKPARLLRRRK